MKKSVFATIIGLLATISAFAYSGGNGTEQEPYLISSKADMEELATTVNKGQTYEGVYFLLTRDLTGEDDVISSIIGTSNTRYFSGIFDGDGHEIKVIINSTGQYVGVFGWITAATIKNLGVIGSVKRVSASSSAYSGGICGVANSSTISNCYNLGDISASAHDTTYSAYSGGICGSAGSSTISNCYNVGNISASDSYSSCAGGICGAGGTITNCYNTGNVSAAFDSYTSYAGGICGSVYNGTITNCYNTGDISTSSVAHMSCAGGICGSSGGTIANCYNTGDISASSDSYTSCAGGICGYIYDGTLTNCYNAGNISASDSYSSCAGGICGSNSGTITNCYNTGNISVSSDSYSSCAGGICGGSGKIITNCYNTGDVSVSSVSSVSCVSCAGGICGDVSEATLTNCYNTGDISSTSSVSCAGGICGKANNSTIANCYNIGDISASAISASYSASYAGGICGGGAIITNCIAANTTITVISNSIYAGRIAGTGGTVKNCYALAAMQINDVTSSSQDANSKDGKDENIASFQLQSWIEENVEWDFDKIWEMSIINSIFQGFPIFKNQTNWGLISIETPKLEEKRDIVVYPNPASNRLHITGYNIQKSASYSIFNLTGRAMMQGQLVGETTVINVEALPAGVYFIRTGDYLGKFIKND